MKPIIALLLAAAPLAAAAAQDTTVAAKPAKPAKAKRICRSQRETGSNMAVSTCHTQAEWDAIEQNDQASVDAYRRQQIAQPH